VLTILQPEILFFLKDFPGGLFPLRQQDGSMSLVLKLMKENILTVRVRREFRIYIAPTKFLGRSAFGLVTAFFDDMDEPLCLFSPMADGDPFTDEITELFSQETFNVYFFDDQDRELLGYEASNPDHKKMADAVKLAKFPPPDLGTLRQQLADLGSWFANRLPSDDASALRVNLGRPLYPEDLAVIDYRPEVNDHFGDHSPKLSMLERPEPGRLQEIDIIGQLRRVFSGRNIFHGPIRSDDGKEYVDILVATKDHHFIIQAKDSPNTEASLNRGIVRKKSTSLSHMDKAVAQLRGAINYWKNADFLHLLTMDLCHKISTEGRSLWGIVVVKELFDGDQFEYSRPVLNLSSTTQTPCIVVDYRQLHEITFHRRDERGFIDAVTAVYEGGLEYGHYPRLRFGLVADGDVNAN
jgi:hypothetical protein